MDFGSPGLSARTLQNGAAPANRLAQAVNPHLVILVQSIGRRLAREAFAAALGEPGHLKANLND